MIPICFSLEPWFMGGRYALSLYAFTFDALGGWNVPFYWDLEFKGEIFHLILSLMKSQSI